VQLAKEGRREVDVFCPGFPADCLETLEEIAIECKAAFLAAGGQDFHYVPALNDDPRWIDALAQIALDHLQGWLAPPDPEELGKQASRAFAAGAKI
jgi:ferrochelatase